MMVTTGVFSQVGIGTNTPNPSSILDLTSTDKGLLLPRVATTSAIVAPVNGMMVYDISANCLKAYENNAWSSCISAFAGTIVNCNANGFQGSYSTNLPFTAANVFTVTITNSASSPSTFSETTLNFATGDLVLSGITGVSVASVSPASVTLIGGQSQVVTYTLAGTPTSIGTLTATWTNLSLNCIKTIPVLSPTITTLDCATAMHSGTLISGVAASGVTSTVPYTGGNGASFLEQSVNSTGVTGLTATIQAGTLANGAGNLSISITGTPDGVGGTASFALNFGGVSCTLTRSVTAGSITALNCGTATGSGTLTSGNVASGVSYTVPYTGGNGGNYATQTIPSTGVTGLTATITAGAFASGTGNLSVDITGTPSSNGTASFALTIGGQSCTLATNVEYLTPANITLAQNQDYFVASIFDQDYLPYAVPTGAAATGTQDADGTNEATTLNVQGVITTTAKIIRIPINATGSGTLSAFTNTVTIPASMTEDGISRDVRLSWVSQSYSAATKTILATLQSIGGTLNVKKLDLNAGLGNNSLGIVLGNITYPYNDAGATTNLNIRVIPGLPDKMFGVADNDGDASSHLMLYVPVVAENGIAWLNNNLGANYANITKPSFNPNSQATAVNDFNAYGNFFQWGRKPDGHELINWTSGTSGVGINGSTTTLSDVPTNTLFVTTNTTPYDWRVTQDDTLWLNESGANNPCPSGYRLATATEFGDLVFHASLTNRFAAVNQTVLRLPTPGVRNLDDIVGNVSTDSSYWTGTPNGTEAISRYFAGGTLVISEERALGFSVRCIKN